MNLEQARGAYEDLSGKASDISRQLCLAAIALVWLFKEGGINAPMIPAILLKAAFLVFLALLCDLSQYLIGTIVWFRYFRHKERHGIKDEEEFLAPEWLNWPTWILFFVKTALTVGAYVCFIVPFLFQKFIA